LHGRRKEGQWAKESQDFENFRKKVVFVVSSGKKQISPLLAPHWRKFGKIPW